MEAKLRKIAIITLMIILAPFLVVAFYYVINYHKIQMDGVKAEIYSLTMGEDTRYSERYSDRIFLTVETGMNKKEILDQLGPPLFKYFINADLISNDSISDTVYYHYSMASNGGNFRHRFVAFEGETVARVGKEFYYD